MQNFYLRTRGAIALAAAVHLGSPTLLGCAPGSPLPTETDRSDDRQSALLDCPNGVALPPTRPDNNFAPGTEALEIQVIGRASGSFDERAPTPYKQADTTTLDAESRTVERRGWWLDAEEGEAFDFEKQYLPPFTDQAQIPVVIYGPVVECAAAEVDRIAVKHPTDIANRLYLHWVAPAQGTYFVAPDYMVRRTGDTIGLMQGESPYTISARRLGPDGLPVLHSLLRIPADEIVGPSLLRATLDLQWKDMDGDGEMEIVTYSHFKLPNEPINLGVLVYRKTAAGYELATLSPTCEPDSQIVHPPARMAIDDFTGDGVLDVVVPQSKFGSYQLHRAEADGSFVCSDATPDYRADYFAGAMDADGDGLVDLIDFDHQQLGSQSSMIWAYVYRNLGDGQFERSAPVQFEIPLFVTPPGDYAGTLADVTGDGVPELVVGMGGKDEEVWYGAFSLPAFGLVEPLTDLTTLDFGRHVARQVDVDLDGFADSVGGTVVDASVGSLLLAHGNASGNFEYPWLFRGDDSTNSSHPIVDLADFDHDGCTDVLTATAGEFKVYRGHHCGKVAVASCVGACGGASSDGCYCDDVCTTFADCCADYAAQCADE